MNSCGVSTKASPVAHPIATSTSPIWSARESSPICCPCRSRKGRLPDTGQGGHGVNSAGGYSRPLQGHQHGLEGRLPVAGMERLASGVLPRSLPIPATAPLLRPWLLEAGVRMLRSAAAPSPEMKPFPRTTPVSSVPTCRLGSDGNCARRRARIARAMAAGTRLFKAKPASRVCGRWPRRWATGWGTRRSTSKLCNLLTARALAASRAATALDCRVMAYNSGFTPGTAVQRAWSYKMRALLRLAAVLRPVLRLNTVDQAGRVLGRSGPRSDRLATGADIFLTREAAPHLARPFRTGPSRRSDGGPLARQRHAGRVPR
jgi:hypothetical protein